jgi:hypothetical protein
VNYSERNYQEVELKGSFSITAMSLNQDGDELMYSRNPDFYQYRTLVMINDTWTEEVNRRGPPIDRRKDRIFIPIGI